MLSAYSLADGTFSLKIPSELIDDDNVIRVSYDEVETKKDEINRFGYGDKDYILSKEEMNSVYAIKAEPLVLVLGGIGHVRKKDPVIFKITKG